MRATISKFEESEEVILRKVHKVFVGGCHGNDLYYVPNFTSYTEQV